MWFSSTLAGFRGRQPATPLAPASAARLLRWQRREGEIWNPAIQPTGTPGLPAALGKHPIKPPPPTPPLRMGKLLAFKRPSAACGELEELLRGFYAAERRLAACEWLEEAALEFYTAERQARECGWLEAAGAQVLLQF